MEAEEYERQITMKLPGGNAFRDVLPENVDLMGFYSFGEICPQVMESGHIYNCFHNDTFTILAI